MAEFSDTLGTGETYTTIAAWENARNISEAWSGDREGNMKAESIGTGTTAFSGGDGDTGGTYSLVLSAVSGAEHDGRSNAVSSAGNARTSHAFQVSDAGRYVFSWIEINSTSSAPLINILSDNMVIQVHHNIMWNGTDTTNEYQIGIYNNSAYDGGTWDIYRNAIYGNAGMGLYLRGDNTTSGLIAQNTIALNNRRANAGSDGIQNQYSNAYTIENNAVFGHSPGNDIDNSGGATKDNNATSDATGDSGASLTNLTATDQFASYTSTWASADFTLKDTDADLYEAGDATYSTTTYPEINVPLSDRSTTVGETWSVGADDVAGSPASPTAGCPLFVMEDILA